MSNEVKNSEKKSKSIMRNSKAFRYSRNLMFIVGAMGVTTGVLLSNTEKVKANDKNNDDNLNNTVDETQAMLKKMRNRNKMYIRGANLELIQLMEQGDQIIKSPWSSWQFGMNFFSNANIVSEGYGDREAMYGGYEGQYIRGNWSEKNLLMEGRFLPGILNQNTGYSLFYSTGKTPNYGFANLNNINEPEVEIQIMASVRPKSIEKEEILLTPQIDEPRQIVKPEVNLNVNSPLEATDIKFPNVKPVSINVETPGTPSAPGEATAPSMNISLTPPTVQLNVAAPKVEIGITAPNPEISLSPINIPPISKVSAISVSSPETPTVTPPTITVNPISFTVPSLNAYKNADNYTMNENKNLDGEYRLSTAPSRRQSAIAEYIDNSGDFTTTENTVMYVDVAQKRAITLDPGRPLFKGGLPNPNFTFTNNGKIYLEAPNTAGIEVQPDTHTGTMITKGTNNGLIEGKNNNQVALLFTSENATTKNYHTLVNKKKIVMGGENSAGFATSDFSGESNTASWHMTAINEVGAEIEMNNASSHGMVVSRTAVPIGSDSKFENKGSITLNGIKSGGITLLAQLPGGAINTGTIIVKEITPLDFTLKLIQI